MPLPKARDNFSTIWRIAKTITVPNTVDRGPDASIQFILLSEFPGKTKHQAMDKMMLYLHIDGQTVGADSSWPAGLSRQPVQGSSPTYSLVLQWKGPMPSL